jgi:asparagine synthase (glutamine-hydrolysing)
MCGISGIISTEICIEQEVVVRKMNDALSHRGPDGEGYWTNTKKTVHLGHRRLSIIDLSDAASQPMHYLDRYTIVYNGEIYNYPELRKTLITLGHTFITNSDTEIILAAYHHYGEDCLKHFDGMYAFSIWDNQEEQLFSARDPYGEKPFFYHYKNEKLFFASEMKALWAAGIEKIRDDAMVGLYLGLGWMKDPSDSGRTFFHNIRSLKPGHTLTYKRGRIEEKNYFAECKNQQSTSDEQTQQIDELLKLSVKRRLRSDVPLGIGLSGGLDSSTLLWYMLQHNKQPVKTFSAIFPGFEKNEEQYIHQLTKAFDVESFFVTPKADELVSDFEKLMYHQEEPVSSSSVFVQSRVYKCAKENGVKVILEGQGADEIFGGYPKYLHWFLQEQIKNGNWKIFRSEKHKLLQKNIGLQWNPQNTIAAFFPEYTAKALENRNHRILSNTKILHPEFRAAMEKDWSNKLKKPVIKGIQDAMYADRNGMNLEVLLRYADRNSMQHGVEVRLPYLFGDLINHVGKMKPEALIHDGFTKWIVRNMMKERLPSEINWRADKVAYEPPQATWMQLKGVSDYLYEAKKKLVDERIIAKEQLAMETRSMAAHAANNYDWRILSVGAIVG